MDTKLLTWGLAAAWGLAGAAYAQTQTTPDRNQYPPTSSGTSSSSSSGTSDPSAASSPHQRDATSQPVPEAPPDSTSPTTTSSAEQRSLRTAEANAAAPGIVGLEVVTPAGDPLGTVVDAVPGQSTTPDYIVISTFGNAVAIPYSAVASMVRDNTVVMDRSRLQNAPKTKNGEWRSAASKAWQSESDRYWNRGGTTRSASPGTNDDMGPSSRSGSNKKKERG